MEKPLSANGTAPKFEFVQTPEAKAPTFEKAEECGVRTTSVSVPCGVVGENILQIHSHELCIEAN
jgi:hypothetical protein